MLFLGIHHCALSLCILAAQTASAMERCQRQSWQQILRRPTFSMTDLFGARWQDVCEDGGPFPVWRDQQPASRARHVWHSLHRRQGRSPMSDLPYPTLPFAYRELQGMKSAVHARVAPAYHVHVPSSFGAPHWQCPSACCLALLS